MQQIADTAGERCAEQADRGPQAECQPKLFRSQAARLEQRRKER
jgi:hypothetical protein